MKKGTPPKNVEEYLAAVPKEAKVSLEKLRQIIKAAAPQAEEVISYRMPMFRYHGMLVAFAAFSTHGSFFVMSPAVMEAHNTDLKSYDTAKGTIHFEFAKPLPASLVKKLVKARIKENEAARDRRQSKRKEKKA